MHLGPQLRAGAQAGEGADEGTRAHRHAQLFAVDVGEGVDHRACRDGGVGDDAVGADPHARPQLHLAFKEAVDVDLHVLRAGQRAAQIKTGRVGQAHALLHQRIGQAALVHTLQLGQLRGAVHTGHLRCVGDLVR